MGYIMKKSKLIIGIIAVIAVISIVCIFVVSNLPKNYSSALKLCTRVLSRNKEEMELISQNVLNSELTSSNYSHGQYKDYSYTMMDNREFVCFDIGAQGMLGGQTWALIYCPNGEYFGESETYYYKEIDGGNNIHRAERIDEHWWFLWVDYDGTELSEN